MTIKEKLSSRKLWTALIGIAIGLAMVFGLDPTAVNTVSGAVVSLVSAVVYIYTEGRIDVASVAQAAKDIQFAIDVLDETEGSE